MRALLASLIFLATPVAFAQYGVQTIRDVPYTSASGFTQVLDLYLPTPTASHSRPGVMLVHGGGWAAGNKSDFEGWGQYYAAKGFVCAAVSYRFAPQHVWPAQIDDVQASVRWMRKNAQFLGLNPRKIGAVGMSAGGHLVEFLSLTDTLNDFDPLLWGYSSRVALAVNFVGPCEFSDPNEWSPAIWPLVTQMVGQPWSPFAMKYRYASPINYIDSADSPILHFYGVQDDTVPISQGRRMAARLNSKGVLNWYFEFPNEGHGFSGETFSFCVDQTTAKFKSVLQSQGP